MINDVRDANNGMTGIMRRQQLHNNKKIYEKSPQDGGKVNLMMSP